MAMGKSAGRSAGNRQAGPRRAPQRERDLIDAPGFSEWTKTEEARAEEVRLERKRWWTEMLLWGLWTFACVFMAIVFAAWWNLI